MRRKITVTFVVENICSARALFKRSIYKIMLGMAIRVVEFSKRRVQDWKHFFIRINIPMQRKLLSFEFWINSELSKIGRHFSNKKISNMIYQKMSITKDRCAPKLVFFNKKMRGIQMIFEIEN